MNEVTKYHMEEVLNHKRTQLRHVEYYMQDMQCDLDVKEKEKEVLVREIKALEEDLNK